jgi:hypothetical protein
VSKPPPKVALDPHPPAYRTPVPSFPRDPRVPSDLGELPGADGRDTDPITGGHEVIDDPEKTPAESPHSLKRLSEKMDQTLAAARDAANNSLTMMGRLDEFARELKVLAQRVTALEVSRQWAPLLIASIALAMCIWLTFRVIDLQAEVLTLQRILEP